MQPPKKNRKPNGRSDPLKFTPAATHEFEMKPTVSPLGGNVRIV
jgi:hypothetical protein